MTAYRFEILEAVPEHGSFQKLVQVVLAANAEDGFEVRDFTFLPATDGGARHDRVSILWERG